MKITGIRGGMMETNCWFLTDENSGKTAVIDPGFLSDRLYEMVKKFGFIEKILLTHGHFDHITAADSLRRETGAKLYIMRQEAPFLENPALNLSESMGAALPCVKADVLLEDGDEIPLGSLNISVLATPGHTAGSCCYLVQDAIFTGDTVFCGSVGRTDFPTGNTADILSSVTR